MLLHVVYYYIRGIIGQHEAMVIQPRRPEGCVVQKVNKNIAEEFQTCSI